MKTTIQEQENQFVVRLEGELDTAAAMETAELLKPLYTNNGKDVLFECEKLEYISSSGLRILVSIHKGARACGSKVILKDVNDDLKNVFKVTGMNVFFEFV
jgi:anti-anti-sigma factor